MTFNLNRRLEHQPRLSFVAWKTSRRESSSSRLVVPAAVYGDVAESGLLEIGGDLVGCPEVQDGGVDGVAPVREDVVRVEDHAALA